MYDRATALVVVDVQNDFADRAGSLYVRGAEQILPIVNLELSRAAAAGAMIVYTQDWHPAATPHFGTWPPHCIRGTWGARLHPALDRIRAATVILKGTGGEDGYSGFSSRDPVSGRVSKTALEDVLRRHGVGKLVIAGLATDYCVRHTALEALAIGFEVAVLDDAVRAVDRTPGDGARAIDELARRGAQIVSSADFHQLPHELGAS